MRLHTILMPSSSSSRFFTRKIFSFVSLRDGDDVFPGYVPDTGRDDRYDSTIINSSRTCHTNEEIVVVHVVVAMNYGEVLY